MHSSPSTNTTPPRNSNILSLSTENLRHSDSDKAEDRAKTSNQKSGISGLIQVIKIVAPLKGSRPSKCF